MRSACGSPRTPCLRGSSTGERRGATDIRGRGRARGGDHPPPRLGRCQPERDARAGQGGQGADRAVRTRAGRRRRRTGGAPPRRAREPSGRRGPGVSTWGLLADLPVRIEQYTLDPLQATVSSEFERKSTVIRLRGSGEEGLGEDVTYDAVDHEILQTAGPTLALAGRFTLASFCARLAELQLFPEPPQRKV